MGRKKSCICINLIILFILFILFICPINAIEEMTEDEFFDYLNENIMVTSVNDIEYNENDWNINKEWITKGNTKVWIDIPGYNYTVKQDGEYYINQSYIEAAYIMYGTDHKIKNKWNYAFDSLESNMMKKTINDKIEIIITTKLKYHTGKLRCIPTLLGIRCNVKKIPFEEDQVFVKYFNNNNIKTYPLINISKNATIKVYNNTLYPKIIIYIPKYNNSLGYSIKYGNESIQYFYNLLLVDKMDNGFPYGNMTNDFVNPIYSDSKLFHRFNNKIVMNTTHVNNTFEIMSITPYENIMLDYDIIINEPPKFDNEHIINSFKMIVGVFIIVIMFRYMRRKYAI